MTVLHSTHVSKEKEQLMVYISVREKQFLVPAHMGWMEMEGNMDLFLASYRNENI